jgi:hypothetical protein
MLDVNGGLQLAQPTQRHPLNGGVDVDPGYSASG